MRMVRNRSDARWLPSRHDFALFRLVAWLRLRKRPHLEETESMFVIDRHQNVKEMWSVGLWMLLTTACYITDALMARVHPMAAWVGGFILSLAALQAAVVLSGLIAAPLWKAITRSDVLPLRINSVVVMALFLGATAWAATRPTWARFVAWSVIAVVAMNLVATIAVYLLRDSIAELESAIVGGTPSEP